MAPELTFPDVDRAPDPAPFVAFLDAMGAVTAVRDGKRERAERLAHAGAHVLDVGCGTGDDVRAMGPLVGPHGRAVGLDSSGRLLAVSRERTGVRHGPVEWVHGDAHTLPFDDETFDVARAERVLQHLAHPAHAVAEMARVVRAGGKVVVVEPDWGTLVVDLDPPDAARAVADAAAAGLRHPWIGRRLRRLLADAGLERIEVRAEPMTVVDLRLVPDLERALRVLAQRARAAGLAAEWAAVAADARDAVASGRCFGALTLFVAEGSRRAHGGSSIGP